MLGSALLPRVVDGIQQNVMAIVKHYVSSVKSTQVECEQKAPTALQIGNTQETDRTTVNEIVDETLLMELYGPPFAAAVQHSAGVMVRMPE